MTRIIFVAATFAGLLSAPVWGAAESESSDAAPTAPHGSQINSLYGALLVAMLSDSQGVDIRRTLRETPTENGSNASSANSDETGLAAVYSPALAGHRTANGGRYEPTRLTAAHKLLPFGTHVRVTNLKNAKTVQVTITDRGPRQAGRVIDLSRAAARQLGIGAHGMAQVRLTVLRTDPQKSGT